MPRLEVINNFEDYADYHPNYEEPEDNSKKTKKPKRKALVSEPLGWDDEYDPSRPIEFEHYLGSEEQQQARAEWQVNKAELGFGKAGSKSSAPESDKRVFENRQSKNVQRGSNPMADALNRKAQLRSPGQDEAQLCACHCAECVSSACICYGTIKASKSSSCASARSCSFAPLEYCPYTATSTPSRDRRGGVRTAICNALWNGAFNWILPHTTGSWNVPSSPTSTVATDQLFSSADIQCQLYASERTAWSRQ